MSQEFCENHLSTHLHLKLQYMRSKVKEAIEIVGNIAFGKTKCELAPQETITQQLVFFEISSSGLKDSFSIFITPSVKELIINLML